MVFAPIFWLCSTQTVFFEDAYLNLTTTKDALLQTDFAVNLDRALQPLTSVIDHTVVLSTVRPVPDASPRPFDYEFNWEETPFRYDPLGGTNLLLEFGNPFGFSISSPQFDATTIPNGRVILQTPELPDRGEVPYYYHLFVTQFLYKSVLSGDFNRDGIVDDADNVLWRKSDGAQEDYNIWRANIGATADGAAAAAHPLPNVPEPPFLVCLIAAGAGAHAWAHARKSRRRRQLQLLPAVQ